MNHFEALDKWMKENPQNKNPMVRRFGKGPEEKKCGSCVFLTYKDFASRYYKCKERGITGGAGTDHRQGYDSCSKFKEKA